MHDTFYVKLKSSQTLPLKQELVVLRNTTICVWSCFEKLPVINVHGSVIVRWSHEIKWLLFLKSWDAPCSIWEGECFSMRPWLSLRAEHEVGMFVETSAICISLWSVCAPPGPCSTPCVSMPLSDVLNWSLTHPIDVVGQENSPSFGPAQHVPMQSHSPCTS